MHLRRLARGRWGEVLFVAGANGNCQALEFLLDGAAGKGQQIDILTRGKIEADEDASGYETACTQLIALLREHVPANGPPRDMPLSKSLGGGLFEFRKLPQGKQPRVAWFDDGTRVIVCARAFSKRSKRETDPRGAVDRARELKKQYFEDKKRGQIKITELDDPGRRKKWRTTPLG